MKKIILALIAIMTFAIVAAGCGKKEETIKIGIAGPMTDKDAKMGADFRNAVAIAIDERNAAGGLLNKKVEAVIEDDQSDVRQARSVANKLVNEGVVGVIGHFNSNCSEAGSEVYNQAGIPMISPASTNPRLTQQGYKGVFRVCGTDDQQGKIAARFVTEKLRVRRVAVIHDNTTYGRGLADIFRDSLGREQQVVFYGGITRGDKDFKVLLTSVKERKPDLIYFGGIYGDAGMLVRQAREIDINVPFMSGDGVIDRKFIEIAGPKATEGTYLTFSPDIGRIKSAEGFVEKYRRKYGEPGPYSVYAYVAVNILMDAIKDAGTSDPQKIRDKLRGREFDTALGKIRFDENGNVSVAPYIVWIVRNGKFEEYWKP